MDRIDSEDTGRRLNGRILLTEDDPDTQMMVSWLLRNEGAEVTLAKNGKECIEQVTAAGEKGCPFDMILMDLQMPVLDGHQATQRLRASGCELPIVALTARGTDVDKEKSLENGFNGHICKLAAREELVGHISEYLSQDVEKVQVTKVPLLPIVPTIVEEEPKYASLVLAFLKRLPETLSALKVSMEERDSEGFSSQLNGLGSAELFGYQVLTSTIKQMQQELNSGDWAEIEKLYQELEAVSDRMRAGESMIKDIAEVFGPVQTESM